MCIWQQLNHATQFSLFFLAICHAVLLPNYLATSLHHNFLDFAHKCTRYVYTLVCVFVYVFTIKIIYMDYNIIALICMQYRIFLLLVLKNFCIFHFHNHKRFWWNFPCEYYEGLQKLVTVNVCWKMKVKTWNSKSFLTWMISNIW